MTRATRRRAAAAILATALALAVAGCGSDSGGDDDTAGDRAPAATSATPNGAPSARADAVGGSAGAGSAPAARGFDPARIYDEEAPGVVTVIATGLPRGAGGSGGGLGSGFVVSDTGEIATNAHVVTSGEGSAIREARGVFVRFQDGNQVPAEIVGFDPFSDVALLEIDPDGLDLRPLPLGSSEDVTVGEPVAAIGSPFGEEQSLSIGVVSALNRSISSLTGFRTSGAIQTDAAINSGNSGGPLLNAAGEVLGINSQIRTDSGAGSGVGFAVPVDTVERSLAQLRRSGRVRYAFLGVTSARVYPQLAERFDLPVAQGAWVQTITRGGPADRGGVRAGSREVAFQAQPYRPGGDLIVGVDGTEVVEESDLGEILLDHDPGDRVTLTLYRDGEKRDVEVTLADRPAGLTNPRG